MAVSMALARLWTPLLDNSVTIWAGGATVLATANATWTAEAAKWEL